MKEKSLDRDRRNFIKKGIAGIAGITILPSLTKRNLYATPVHSVKNNFIYRTLGKTAINLPVVSMGVMNADNPNLVHAALDAGIVLLDTANGYQNGRNEEMIGGVIKDRTRDSFVLATKVVADNQDRKTGLFTKDTNPDAFLERFEISLKRLGLDYVDILYLHSVVRREAALFEPILSLMIKLKKEGKTRFIGVSTHRNEPEVIQAATDSKIYDVILTAYNFRQPHLAEMNKTIAEAAKAGLGIVAMKTQAGVFWDRERQNPINMKAALKWALQNENIHTAIPGFTTFDQMNDDISVMKDLSLTPEEKEDLRLGELYGMSGLYCDQCNECMNQCREHLDIPTFMRSYMYAYGYKNLAAAQQTLSETGFREPPCSNCDSCVVNCSLGFNIKDKIMDIARVRSIPDDFLV